MADYFRIPFAESGDRNVIPETTPDTEVSLTTGWTTAYAEDPTTSATARRLQRQNFNGLFHTIMTAVQQYQQEGVYDFITSAQNGGVAFPYAQDALVRYEDPPATTRVYRSLVNNNTELPTVTANWTPIDAVIDANTAATLLSLLLTTSDPVDLTDTGNALNIGTATPASNPHLALSANQLQAKATSTTTAGLDIQSLGGNINLGPQSGTGLTSLYAQAALIFRAEAAGSVAVFGDQNNDTDDRLLRFRQADGTERGQVGHASSDVFVIRNLVNSGNVLISGANTGGSDTSILQGDPDGELTGNHAGLPVFVTRNNGLRLRGSLDNPIGGNQNCLLEYATTSGTALAFTGFIQGDPNYFIRNINHGSLVRIQGEDTGGVLRDLIQCDPDDNVILFQAGVAVARTNTIANGGFEVSRSGGFERVLTTNDLPGVGIKTANTSRANTAALAIDNDFTISILVGDIGRYRLEGHLWYDAGAGGIQLYIDYSTTAASENVTFIGSRSGLATPIQANPFGAGGTFASAGTTSRDSIDISGTFEATAAGAIRLFWAQQISDAANTVLRENSYLSIERIA